MKVLIIDENKHIADSLLRKTDKNDLELHSVFGVEEGVRVSQEEGFDIILMRDIISGQPSCFAIQDLRNSTSFPEILIFTEQGDSQHAKYALEGGAWDYVVGSNLDSMLPDILERVVRFRDSKTLGREEKHKEMRQQLEHQGIIGSSAAIQNCLNLVTRVSQSDASVLITGETGTGKELFASAIHVTSKRHRNNLTIIDCAALPSTLVESILFGHAKGSFTGADKAQKGLIKQADGGTLFLDEIGEMPLEIQKKFLRVLQEQKYLPVGSSNAEKSDFRLIAATNRDLDAMVAAGEFREDLLYRLKTFHLELPSLRSRKSDIAELTYYFRNNYCRKNRLKRKKMATDFLITLTQYDWPGNVRELFQALEYSITDAQESTILEAAHLPVNIRLAVTKQKMEKIKSQRDKISEGDLPDLLSAMPTMKEDRERAIQIQEKGYLQKLLTLTNGEIKRCCKTAGLSRSRLYDLLKKYNLSQKNTTLHSPDKE